MSVTEAAGAVLRGDPLATVVPSQAGTDPIPEPEVVVDAAEPWVEGAVAFLVVYLVGRYAVRRGIVELVDKRNPNNPTLRGAVRRYTQLTVLVVAAFVGLGVAGVGGPFSRSSLVIAAVTLAIGVAGQDVIGNVVAGLFLVADPDFNVGDFIAWDDHEGTVEAISFRVTRVRSPNNEVVVVPNTELATNAVTRPFGRDRFRLVEEFEISYDDDLDEAEALVRETLAELDPVLGTPKPVVRLGELGGDAVHLHAEFWIDNPTRRNVSRLRATFVRRVKDRFEAAGITLSPASQHELSGELGVEVSPGGDPDAE